MCDINKYLYLCLTVFTGFVLSKKPYNCTRRCSVQDSSDECWVQSLDYFTSDAARAIDEYVGTILYVARWRYNLGNKGAKYAHLEQEQLNKTLQALYASHHHKTLPQSDMYEILKLALEKAKPLEHPDRELPNFHCPVPCQYEASMWMYLFWVMFGITVLLFIAVTLYIVLYKDSNFIKKKRLT